MKKLAAIQISGLTPVISDGEISTDYMDIYLDNSVIEKSEVEDGKENGSTTPMNFYLSYRGSDYGVEHVPDDKNMLLVFGLGI